MTRPIARADLERFSAGLAEKRRRLAKAEHQTRGYRDDDGVWQCGLLSFVRYFWHVLEPDTPFVSGWVLEAICEHFEAVTYGDIKNLLVNVFPGAMKSLLLDVFLPAWEWGPLEMPHLRYIAFSYSAGLTERDNEKFRDLILSDEYQLMYGEKVKLRKIGSTKVSNARHGWKLATSVGGVGTGERADKLFLDDPHNVKESESKIVITETVRWFRESMSDRLNNIDTGSKIVIMQRISEADVSATILDMGFDYVHLCIPMEFVWTADDDGNPYTTDIGWVDPRWTPDPEDCNGALAWEERFPESAVTDLKKEKGPYAWAAQYSQTPEARGGGLIKRDWWMPAEVYMKGDKFPPFNYIVASLDGAYTQKEENDACALTVWGIFQNEHGYNRAMLVDSWAKRLAFSGPKVDIEPGEHESLWLRRAMPHWGLIEWVAYSCKRKQVDKLLIEAKASGISAAQSLRNSHGRQGWTIQLVEPKGDKLARGMAVVPSFSQEMIYAPDRPWAQAVVDDCAKFPYGAHDDLYDSTTQAIKHLRDSGLIRSDEELRAEELDAVRHKGAPKPARYPGFAARRA
jgi:predicted phage terminase large subunit-like protein